MSIPRSGRLARATRFPSWISASTRKRNPASCAYMAPMDGVVTVSRRRDGNAAGHRLRGVLRGSPRAAAPGAVAADAEPPRGRGGRAGCVPGAVAAVGARGGGTGCRRLLVQDGDERLEEPFASRGGGGPEDGPPDPARRRDGGGGTAGPGRSRPRAASTSAAGRRRPDGRPRSLLGAGRRDPEDPPGDGSGAGRARQSHVGEGDG